MAAVLDALAPFVKKLVQDMAQDEVSKLLGVSGEITKLGVTMEKITDMVSDAESRCITEPNVQKWVNKLKDAMYDGTDILELCQLEADERRELEEELGEGGSREENLLACFQPLQVWLQSPVVTLITCGGVEKMKGFFQSFLFCLRNPVFSDEIGSRIKELNQRLEGIYEEADRQFKFQRNLGSSKPELKKVTATESSSYKAISSVDESAIVGEQIERDTNELVQVLTTDDNKNQDLKVVSIIGTGGMGKTTLAQKIFNDETIKKNFQTKIWLSITKHFDEAELLRTAIKHAGGDHAGEKEKSTLTGTLIDTLSTKGRFLLVMDDVWGNEAWSHVLQNTVRIASKEQPGSRVIVTTRYADLPQQMQAVLHEHRVRRLDDDDAWSLLKRQLRPGQVVGIDQLKTVGMEILKNCDGLPLAIKVIGGLLSTKYASEHEWKSVLNKLAWSLVGLPLELDKRIYLSYEDLSPQLKQCFLYCSLFPKGGKIMQIEVTSMWISEGFIQPAFHANSTISLEDGLEEIANEYYQDLIKRNLIEPTETSSLTGYKCTMHDVVRTFAEYMAREESLVVVGTEQTTTAASVGSGGMHVRRLSIQHIKQTGPIEEWGVLPRRESLRTLLIHPGVNFQLPGDSLSSLSSLRVLNSLSADFNNLVPSISKLKHLRFLQLCSIDISRLDDIHKLKFLLHITLCHCKNHCHLPRNIIKLVHLRHLDITSSNVSSVPKGFGGLTNLRSLRGFPIHMDKDECSSWCSLQELEPLSQLRHLTLNGLEKVQDSQMAGKAMISSKRHLGYLRLHYSSSGHTIGTSGDEAEQQQKQQSVVKEVLEKLCPPTCLESLSLEGGYNGLQLPNWMHAPASMDFKSLRYLWLKNLLCCTQLPNGLCCLPSLEMLDIKDAPAIKHIGPKFQASSLLTIGASDASALASFPKLRELYLERLREWEEWEWNEYEENRDVETAIAMPCLEKLQIDNCKLSYLPPGLASSKRHALRKLNLYEISNLTHMENFPSVVKLDVFDCPELKRVSGLPMLQKIRIIRCTKLKVLEGVPALNSLLLTDTTMDTLPEYLRAVSPRYLNLECNRKLYASSTSQGSSEWNKINHIRKQNIICIKH